jgi:hypothetical protein
MPSCEAYANPALRDCTVVAVAGIRRSKRREAGRVTLGTRRRPVDPSPNAAISGN